MFSLFPYLANKFVGLTEDLGYQSKRYMVYHVGKQVAQGSQHTIAEGVKGTFLGIAKESLPKLVGMGIIVGVSAGLSQVDHLHRRRRLLDTYRKEIAAQLGKDEAKLDSDDLDLVAYGDPKRGIAGNAAIRQAVEHSRKHRNVGVVLSVISSLAAFAITAALFAAGGPLAIGGWAEFGLQGAVSLAGYLAVKMPIYWIGGKMLGLDEPTVDDKIHAIQRDREQGKVISQEQVFEAYLAGNRDLDAAVRARFGRSFRKLDDNGKLAALQTMGAQIKIDEVTAAINAGLMRSSELAFLSQGERSGVPLGEGVPDKSRWASRLEHLRHRFDYSLGTVAHWGSDLASSFRRGGPSAVHADAETQQLVQDAAEAHVAAGHMAQARHGSFVERLGGRRHDPSLTHVQRLHGEEPGIQVGR